jgi:hypothetical protein
MRAVLVSMMPPSAMAVSPGREWWVLVSIMPPQSGRGKPDSANEFCS